MTDTEERIQKLQKLLDRVLAGDERAEAPGEAPTIEEKKPDDAEKVARPEGIGAAGEDTTAEVEVPHRRKDYAKEVGDVASASAPATDEEKEKEKKEKEKPEGEEAPVALESRSRLVTASGPMERESQGALEVTEADLIPDSEVPDGPESAMPLVRKSRTSIEPEETLSEGRISLDDAMPISSRSFITEDMPTPADDGVPEDVASSELLDDAPSSSRRPIAIPEEEYSAPRHTPPPESGKQVAAPALADATTTGVRKSAGPPALPPQVVAPMPPAPPAPDVLRATLPEAGHVATQEGAVAAPAPRPKTFGELLDAALEL